MRIVRNSQASRGFPVTHATPTFDTLANVRDSGGAVRVVERLARAKVAKIIAMNELRKRKGGVKGGKKSDLLFIRISFYEFSGKHEGRPPRPPRTCPPAFRRIPELVRAFDTHHASSRRRSSQTALLSSRTSLVRRTLPVSRFLKYSIARNANFPMHNRSKNCYRECLEFKKSNSVTRISSTAFLLRSFAHALYTLTPEY